MIYSYPAILQLKNITSFKIYFDVHLKDSNVRTWKKTLISDFMTNDVSLAIS